MRWLRLVVFGLACAAAVGCSSLGLCGGGGFSAYSPAASPGCGCGP